MAIMTTTGRTWVLLCWLSCLSLSIHAFVSRSGGTVPRERVLKAFYDESAGGVEDVLDPNEKSVAVDEKEEDDKIRDELKRELFLTKLTAFQSAALGPPLETKPDYENIVGPLGKRVDNLFLSVFRGKLAEQVGSDSSLPTTDYNGIVELAASMNKRFTNRQEIQRRAQEVLRALFPSWLPRSYAMLFSRPFPAFSSRMNAWATKVAGVWLMGEVEINDVEIDGGTMGRNQGLLVKRCRFLEESGCASVCVNSCKVPTQNFFAEDMGLPLTMTPNYETFECQFAFGATPNLATELEAKNTPCLMRCPTAGSLRKWHDGSVEVASETVCKFMDDEQDFLLSSK